MRLTSVTQMALPPGRLWSLSLQVGERLGTRPVSFDQARHVGAGDRSGSWMAIALRLSSAPRRDHLADAWLAVVARHDTLRTVFTSGPGGPELHEVQVVGARWVEHEVAADRDTREVLRDVLDATCRPLSAPSHRLAVVEEQQDRCTLVIASDHAHVDMWSLLVLVRDLRSALDRPPGPVGAELADRSPAAPAFAEHTAELAARPPAPVDVRQRWAEILEASGGVMPRFPLPLGDLSRPRPGVVEVRDVLDPDQVATLAERAGRDGVRMIALVVSAMVETTASLAGEPLRAVFPVHSRHHPRWHDAVGWFITNAVLEATDPDPRACAEAVTRAVELGSWPLADVLAAYGGMPEAPGMFAVSWLDTTRLPVGLEPALEPQYVGAAIETDGVMVWFVVNTAGLHLRCRYPDTAEAGISVPRWLDDVAQRLTGSTLLGPTRTHRV